jgi:hypothetical protein
LFFGIVFSFNNDPTVSLWPHIPESELGERLHCLALGGADLTSPSDRMTMGGDQRGGAVRADLLIERTQSTPEDGMPRR